METLAIKRHANIRQLKRRFAPRPIEPTYTELNPAQIRVTYHCGQGCQTYATLPFALAQTTAMTCANHRRIFRMVKVELIVK